MAIRCKFKCVKSGQTAGWGASPILSFAEFQPVTDGSPENKAFWEATPSGKLEVSNTKGLGFDVGKEYFIDITPAEPEKLAVA